MIASLDELTSWSSMSVPLAHAAAINPLSRTEANALAFTRYPFDLGFTKIINIDRKSCSPIVPFYFYVRMRDMCTRACTCCACFARVARALHVLLLAHAPRLPRSRLQSAFGAFARVSGGFARVGVCAFGACVRSARVRVRVRRECVFGASVLCRMCAFGAYVAFARLRDCRDCRLHRFDSRQSSFRIKTTGTRITPHASRTSRLGPVFRSNALVSGLASALQ